MGLRKNKKGVIFTVLAIVIAVFFTLVFSARVEKPLDDSIVVVETRINVLNNYMNNFFEYAQAAASITGYSSLQGVIEDINNTNDYNNNFNTQYVYCIVKGNLTSNKICPGMTNNTLTYYLNNIKTIGEDELNINSDYTINYLNISQTIDAFSIEVNMNISLNIEDAYANISDTRIITSLVSIEEILDPLYLINGTYSQPIKKTSLKRKEGDWNMTDLQQLYYDQEYRNYKEGISFINRIKGNFSPTLFGIESFVNHTGPGVAYDNNDTMVDYLFWQKKKFSCTKEIVKINSSIISPSGFQIDDTHRLGFNISGEYAEYTC